MSRQRKPSSSDWRRPVIAASSTKTRSTGPRTSGGGGGAGPRRPRRVGAGMRMTTSFGDRPDDRLQLIEGEETKVRIDIVGPSTPGLRCPADRVVARPLEV